ncbi:hypothetical protein N658DRAFT_523153 [Parathielavia hyrcaniae]|uniref:Uncharacterized protein n=1 Tax=Parathielavia hyrcaniae TaxID=113614 RepID=A0AAN6Q323_9PEZI|nr:hypothetical protein N658DRAFT_523153 [Parathielavia hyrcaniae]
MLILIGHIKPERILFAPPGGSHPDIDEAVYCTELGLAPRVVSLLKRLPYWASSEFVEWAETRPDSYLPNYRDPEQVRRSRRVCGLPIGINPLAGLVDAPLRPGDVILFFEREGETWILDTEANTIRRRDNAATMLDQIRQQYPDYVPEFPDETNHYRNRPALHAPTVLADYVEDLRRLVVMPTGGLGTIEANVVSTDWNPGVAEVREALLQQYGWPDAFRAQEWRREGPPSTRLRGKNAAGAREGFDYP